LMLREKKDDSYFSRAGSPRIDMVYSRNDKLCNATDGKTSHEKNAPTADLGDDAAIHHDGEDTHRGQDARIHKRTSDIGHLHAVSITTRSKKQ
jgi:hypothetical protein